MTWQLKSLKTITVFAPLVKTALIMEGCEALLIVCATTANPSKLTSEPESDNHGLIRLIEDVNFCSHVN